MTIIRGHKRQLMKISLTFLRKSRPLTWSCILCVFISTFLLILMLELSHNARASYIQSIKDAFGDCDYVLTKEDEGTFSEAELHGIADMNEVEQVNSSFRCYTHFDNEDQSMKNITVLMIGADDGELNCARYHYHSSLQGDRLVINEKLAGLAKVKRGDTLLMEGHPLTVEEIIYEDHFSYQNVCFAVMERSAVCRALGKENNANVILVKRNPDSTDQELQKTLQQFHPDQSGWVITSIEESEEYQKEIIAFEIVLHVMAVIVFCVSGLFIANIFRSFLKKYQRDMTILRTIGGSKKQVVSIFAWLGIYTAGCGTLGAFLFSAVIGKLLFEMTGEIFHLTAGARNVNLLRAAGVSVGIFILVEGFLVVTILLFHNKLPLQSMRQQGVSDGIYRGNSLPARLISHFLKKEALISFKLAISKLKENILMILTIMMLTLFSYVGESFMEENIKNSEIFYRNQYLDEVMVSSDQYYTYAECVKIYDALSKSDKKALFPMFDCGGWENINLTYQDPDTGKWDFFTKGWMISDLRKIKETAQITIHAEADDCSVLVSEAFAEQKKIKTGDKISMKMEYYEPLPDDYWNNPEKLPEERKIIHTMKKEVTVSGMVPSDQYGSMVLDFHNPILSSMHQFDEQYSEIRFFAPRETDSLEAVLLELRWEYPALIWQSFTSQIMYARQVLQGRYLMFRTIIYCLGLVAGFGWFFAARNMICSRRKEYLILRKIGMEEKSIRKIIWQQLILFVAVGILGGILFGSVVVRWLGFREAAGQIQIQVKNMWFILAMFGILLSVLCRTVRENASLRI